MIAPVTPTLSTPGKSENLRENTSRNTSTNLLFPQLLNQSVAPTASKPAKLSPAGTAIINSRADLQTYLHKLTGSTNPATVNEEQLFASILHNRITASKGEGLAQQFDDLLDTKLAEHTRPDGVVFVEDAARAVLREMAASGKLTMAEAEAVHGQAFQAAQLDENTTALYDSLGDTRSIAPTATAMEKALAMLLKFDNGELLPATLSLAYEQGSATVAVAGATINGTAGHSQSAEHKSRGVANGGRQYWRIPQSGPDFGKQLTAVFADGHTVVVNDTSQRYTESDGFIFRPGIGREDDPNNNTWTSHKGVFIHAPFGNDSTKVKLYWS